MVIIGLALFVVAGVFGVDLAAKNRFATRNIHVFGESLGFSGSAHLYVVGAITGAALVLGLALLLAGLQRKGSKANQRRRDHKAANAHESELEQLRAENVDLRSRLEAFDHNGRDNMARDDMARDDVGRDDMGRDDMGRDDMGRDEVARDDTVQREPISADTGSRTTEA